MFFKSADFGKYRSMNRSFVIKNIARNVSIFIDEYVVDTVLALWVTPVGLFTTEHKLKQHKLSHNNLKYLFMNLSELKLKSPHTAVKLI